MLLSADGRYDRCQPCSRHRSTLYTQSIRLENLTGSRLEPSSHTTYSSLTSDEKDERMRKLHDSVRRSEKEVQYLKARLEEVVETRSVPVDDDIDDDLHTVMRSESSKILEEFPEGSFGRLFWRQQLDAASRKDKRGMRWDPLMVKWCLYLRHKSSGAYELLRDSGCISLPSQRTLRDYTHYVNSTAGFSNEIDTELGKAARIDSCEEYKKCVVMLMDEMYVKEELVYDKHTGCLTGFVNMGDINSHLLAFEQSLALLHKILPLQSWCLWSRGCFLHSAFLTHSFPVTRLLDSSSLTHFGRRSFVWRDWG